MKRLSRQIAYQAAYGDECFVLDKDAVKDFINSREKIDEAAKVKINPMDKINLFIISPL